MSEEMRDVLQEFISLQTLKMIDDDAQNHGGIPNPALLHALRSGEGVPFKAIKAILQRKFDQTSYLGRVTSEGTCKAADIWIAQNPEKMTINKS